MSIDNRVVHLGFDNAQFEAGVARSMSTLDKLKAKLEFKDGSSGLAGLQNAIDSVSFNALLSGVQALEHRFSLLGIAGMNVANKITDSVIGAAKKLEQATIGQIKSGGWSRAMNLANAQFTVEGLKLDWTEMLKAINYGVQDTAYGLDAAAKAASSLAASGVEYKESVDGANDSLMHTSLRAISGVAAMYNSTYEDIARIFTQVSGQGKVMGDQLLQLSGRGMNAAAILGQQLNRTEGEIREMVSKGQIDFETFAKAMDDAFGAHAKDANKTFQGALSNMKSALSRIGAIFATPIIEKTNEVFIALTNKIKEAQKALSDFTDDEGNKVIKFAGHFAEAWGKGVEVVSELINKFDMSWFDKIAEKMDSLAQKTTTFFKDFKFLISGYHDDTEKMADETGKTLAVTTEEASAARKVIDGLFGNGAVRANKLKELFGEDSAKRIQDYVDSVVAAGWDYDKAAIKVVDTNKEVSGSVAEQVKAAKEQRKIKFHAILNQLSAAFGNFKRAGSNLISAASKIGNAIWTAFKNVFGVKDMAYDSVKGLAGLIIKFANFTEKLIVSDYVASKITTKFTSFFTTIKNGIGHIKNAITFIGGLIAKFVKARIAIAQLPQAAQDALIKSGAGIRIFGVFQTLPSFIVTIINKIKDIFGHLKDIKIPLFDETTGSLWDKIKAFGTNLWEQIKTSFKTVDWSQKIQGLFNFLNDILKNVDFSGLAKIGAIAFVVNTLVKVFFTIKGLGNVVQTVAGIPASIKKVFNNLADVFGTAKKSLSKMASAYSFFTIAKAIALIGGIVIGLASVDQSALNSAISVIVVIAAVLAALAKLIDNMTRAADESKGIVKSFKDIANSVKTIYSMAVLIAAIGAAVLLIGGAASLLAVSGVNGGTMLLIVGILTSIGLMMLAVVRIIEQFPEGASTAKVVGSLLAASVLIAVIAGAVISISVTMKLLTTIQSDSVMSVIDMLALTFGAIAGIIYLSTGLASKSPGSILSAAVVIAAIGFALSAIVLSVATAIGIITAALTVGNADPMELMAPLIAFISVVAIVVAALGALTAVAVKASEDTDTGKLIGTILAMSVMLSALSGAILLMSLSMKLLSGSGLDFNALTGLTLIIGGVALLIEKVKDISPGQLLSAAVTFVGIGVAIGLLVWSVNKLSKISFAASGLLVAAGVIALVIIAFSKIAKLQDAAGNISSAASSMRGINASIGYIIAGVVAFALSMLVLAAAFKVMSGVENITNSLLAMVVLIITIGIAVGALTAIASKSFNSGDALFAVGAAFIMIAAAMVILAYAVEKMASVNGSLLTVAVVFGAFLLVMVGLGALVAKFPKLGEGIMTVGKAFLYMGVGAALVGVGIWLVVQGIQTILPYIPLLITDVGMLLTMLEGHFPILIVITVIIVALTVAIVTLGMTAVPIITAIADVVKSAAEVIMSVLKAIGNGAKNFMSNMSTKGKAAIVTLITTLCAALLKASPEVLETIGKLIIKGLDYLASIIGAIAKALFNFLIKLINGLADAIRMHSNRLVAAIANLVYSLMDVILSILRTLIVGMFGDTVGGKIAELLDKAQLGLDAHAKKLVEDAEAADAAKEALYGYRKELTKTEKTNSGGGGRWDEGSKEESGGLLGSLFDTDKLKEKYGKSNTLPDLSGSGNISNMLGTNMLAGADPNLQTDFMSANGFTTENFSTEGYDGGDSYIGGYNDGLTDRDNLQETADSTQAIVDTTTNTINSPQNYQAVKQATHEGIFTPYNRVMVGNNATYWNNGYDVVDRTVDGMEKAADDNKERIEKIGATTGNLVWRGANSKDGIDANSPSKKFYKSGLWCVLGLQQAIKDNSYLATGQAEDLGNSMVDAIGSPLDYVSKIASGDIEYDPRIRPVMDLSGVGRTATDVSSMFANQNVTLSGMTGQIAYDMTTLNGSNAAVVSELQALREDMEYMTEEMTNMQIVMDTGALVGSTVGAYDDALGRRAVYGERGN